MQIKLSKETIVWAIVWIVGIIILIINPKSLRSDGPVDPSAREFLMAKERSFAGWEFLRQNIEPWERVLNLAERRTFYKHKDTKQIDMTLMYQAELDKAGITHAELIQKERFEYIWLNEVEAGPDLKDELAKNYRKVFVYTFHETVDFRNDFYYRLDRPLKCGFGMYDNERITFGQWEDFGVKYEIYCA